MFDEERAVAVLKAFCDPGNQPPQFSVEQASKALDDVLGALDAARQSEALADASAKALSARLAENREERGNV